MVDLQAVRRAIEKSPQGARRAAVVSRRWLEEVERDLQELVTLRAKKVH